MPNIVKTATVAANSKAKRTRTSLGCLHDRLKRGRQNMLIIGLDVSLALIVILRLILLILLLRGLVL